MVLVKGAFAFEVPFRPRRGEWGAYPILPLEVRPARDTNVFTQPLPWK